MFLFQQFEQIKDLSKEIIESNIEKGSKRVDYAKIKSDVRGGLGKYLYQEIGSKPMIITVIQEVQKYTFSIERKGSL